MAIVKPPSKTERTKAVQTNPTDLTPPEESTMLQLKVPLTLKNDFKAYAAKSPYKTMSELFEACFNEYKDNHPI